MPSKMDVGRSNRTPVKHWLLNSHLGMVCGAITTGRTPVQVTRQSPFLCVDLCAGDGHVTSDHRSSPDIFATHLRKLTDKGVPCEAVFIEKAATTCEVLRRNLRGFGDGFSWTVVEGDARSYILRPASKDQGVFINCDPNSVADMPLTPEMSASLTKFTTLTVTLGCNANGIKRLPRHEREKWGEYVSCIVAPMPAWHDAILVSLIRDDAQWAYITRLPKVWAARESAAIEKKGNALWPNGVEVARYRDQRPKFDAMLLRLFYTKKELAQ